MSAFWSPTEMLGCSFILECIARGSCCSCAGGAKSSFAPAHAMGAHARSRPKRMMVFDDVFSILKIYSRAVRAGNGKRAAVFCLPPGAFFGARRLRAFTPLQCSRIQRE